MVSCNSWPSFAWFLHMTATAHALIGASIASKVVNPAVGIPLAIISHFLADLVPHWDAGTNHRQKSPTRLKLEAAADVLVQSSAVFVARLAWPQTAVSDAASMGFGNTSCNRRNAGIFIGGCKGSQSIPFSFPALRNLKTRTVLVSTYLTRSTF